MGGWGGGWSTGGFAHEGCAARAENSNKRLDKSSMVDPRQSLGAGKGGQNRLIWKTLARFTEARGNGSRGINGGVRGWDRGDLGGGGEDKSPRNTKLTHANENST